MPRSRASVLLAPIYLAGQPGAYPCRRWQRPRGPSEPRSSSSSGVTSPTRPASTCSVTGRATRSTWARRTRSGSGSPRICGQGRRARRRDGRHRRAHRPDRLDRGPGHPERGRGAARRAELHQALPAALQHPPPRRQVLPLRRGQPRRGVSAGLLHPRATPAEPRLLRPVLQRQAGPRDPRSARQALPVPHLRGAGAGPALRRSLPRLLHQALPGALRRLHRPRGVPRQHRPDHRTSSPAATANRQRPRGEDAGGLGGPGLRASGAVSRPAERGPEHDAAPAGRRRFAWQRRPDRGGGRGDRRQRPGVPGSRRDPRRAPGLLPGGRGWRRGRGPRSGRGRRDLSPPVLRRGAVGAAPG